MDREVIAQLTIDLDKAKLHFEDECKKLRTGRAHPSMVEDIIAEAYGANMPLKQLATITTPEAQLIQISPFDPSTISAITQAIRANESLGFNPVDDGRIVRVQVPSLTKKDDVKLLSNSMKSKKKHLLECEKVDIQHST